MASQSRELSSESTENDPPGGRIIEHYRVDPSRFLVRILALAGLIMVIGGTCAGAGLIGSSHVSPTDALMRSGRVDAQGRPIVDPHANTEMAAGLFGLVCVVMGGSIAIFGLRRALSVEAYLVLRTDGVLFRNGPSQVFLTWDQVAEVRWSEQGVVFELRDGEEILRNERFAGIDARELARRSSEVRRKAIFGLLRV